MAQSDLFKAQHGMYFDLELVYRYFYMESWAAEIDGKRNVLPLTSPPSNAVDGIIAKYMTSHSLL